MHTLYKISIKYTMGSAFVVVVICFLSVKDDKSIFLIYHL